MHNHWLTVFDKSSRVIMQLVLNPKTPASLVETNLNPFPPGCGDINYLLTPPPLLIIIYQYQPTWNGLLELLEDVDKDDLKQQILRAAASMNGKLYGK